MSRIKFSKAIAIIQNFMQKEKNLRFGTKNTLFRYFWAAILKIL